MPSAGPTVKSLDERVDDLERTMHAEFADLKVALATNVGVIKEQIAEFRTSLQMSLGLAKWIGGISAAIILTLLGFGFQFSMSLGRLDGRVSAFEQRMDKFDQRVEKVEQRMDKLDQRMEKLEQRMDKFEQRMDAMDKKLDEIIKLVKKPPADKQ